MDSGTYRAYKNNIPLPEIPEGSWDFVVAPDVIGDPEASREVWLKNTNRVPVWHWGESKKLLRWYLEQTDGLVGTGGCVQLMHKRSGALWHGLYKICRQHPGRFHVFGANWLDLLSRIAPYIASADTSKWLDGARYGEVVDRDLRPKKSGADRKDRCLNYAATINQVFNLERLYFFSNFIAATESTS